MAELTSEQKKDRIGRLAAELPVLRVKLGLSQGELGEKVGLSRQMIAAIENRRRSMTWNTYLSLILLFLHNEPTAGLLRALGLYTDELIQFLRVEDVRRPTRPASP